MSALCPLWSRQGKYYTVAVICTTSSTEADVVKCRERTEVVCIRTNKARRHITPHTKSSSQLEKVLDKGWQEKIDLTYIQTNSAQQLSCAPTFNQSAVTHAEIHLITGVLCWGCSRCMVPQSSYWFQVVLCLIRPWQSSALQAKREQHQSINKPTTQHLLLCWGEISGSQEVCEQRAVSLLLLLWNI